MIGVFVGKKNFFLEEENMLTVFCWDIVLGYIWRDLFNYSKDFIIIEI